jgi:ubiquinone/menaquinone biosynthesis C-methylase UbiE
VSGASGPAAERRPPSPEEVGRQFAEQARQYAVSRLHLEGATRLTLIEHMEPVADERLLDVGTGPGPLALAFAPYVERAVGFDLAAPMLEAARLAANRQGIENLTLVAGDVHRLPFPDRSFALVASRACPHHFTDLASAVREMARVLTRGGRLGIADGTVPEDDELDRFLNDLDVLHDPTTVRNYRPSEWRRLVEEAGLRVDWMDEQAYELAEGTRLSGWMARSGASSTVLAEARSRLLEAPERIRRFLRVKVDDEGDVRFHLPRVVFVARRVD